MSCFYRPMLLVVLLVLPSVEGWPGGPGQVESAPDVRTEGRPSATQQSEVHWIFGNARVEASPRVIRDDGLSALIQDQRLGHVPFVFAAQRQYQMALDRAGLRLFTLRREAERAQFDESHPVPELPLGGHEVVLAKGRFITEKLPTVTYGYCDDQRRGARPDRIGLDSVTHTYFLAEDRPRVCENFRIRRDRPGHALVITFDGASLSGDVERVRFTFADRSATATLRKDRVNTITLDITGVENADTTNLEITNTALSAVDRLDPAAIKNLPSLIVSVSLPGPLAPPTDDDSPGG